MHGTVLGGRYRLGDVLGKGGMGEVWRAVDLVLRRPVAVKLLHQDCETDESDRERFRREARLVASLTDTHIVTIHDHGEDQVGGRAVVFLVMELLEGHSMASACRHRTPSVDEVIGWTLQICAGLQAAHLGGVVHRDLKPENIWIAPNGLVKILDFGIARPIAARTGFLTAESVVIGTPAYMAPEQARGQADSSADLYGLGCLMYRLLVGDAPFSGDPWQILMQHAARVPDRVDASRPEIPTALADLVAELLEKDPGLRPPDARSVADRLIALSATYTTKLGGAQPSSPSVCQAAIDTVSATQAANRLPEHGLRLRTVSAALIGGTSLAVQVATFGHWPQPWPLITGAMASAATAAAFWPAASAPLHPTPRHSVPNLVPAGGLLVVVLCIAVTAILLAASVPWWAVLLANALIGPLLLGCAETVRRAVQKFTAVPWAVADLSACVGMINGVAAFGLLAGSLPLFSALVIGVAIWMVCSPVAALMALRPGLAEPEPLGPGAHVVS